MTHVSAFVLTSFGHPRDGSWPLAANACDKGTDGRRTDIFRGLRAALHEVSCPQCVALLKEAAPRRRAELLASIDECHAKARQLVDELHELHRFEARQ